MAGRTTFMIAHRLTTLENCDLLLKIEDGKLESIERDVSESIKVALALDRIETAIQRNN